MLVKPTHVKRYQSAEKRFLKPVIKDFFLREFPKYFGPKVADKIAQEISQICPCHPYPRQSGRY